MVPLFGEFRTGANHNHKISTLETNSFRMLISLESELVFTKPQLTHSGNCRSHE